MDSQRFPSPPPPPPPSIAAYHTSLSDSLRSHLSTHLNAESTTTTTSSSSHNRHPSVDLAALAARDREHSRAWLLEGHKRYITPHAKNEFCLIPDGVRGLGIRRRSSRWTEVGVAGEQGRRRDRLGLGMGMGMSMAMAMDDDKESAVLSDGEADRMMDFARGFPSPHAFTLSPPPPPLRLHSCSCTTSSSSSSAGSSIPTLTTHVCPSSTPQLSTSDPTQTNPPNTLSLSLKRSHSTARLFTPISGLPSSSSPLDVEILTPHHSSMTGLETERLGSGSGSGSGSASGSTSGARKKQKKQTQGQGQGQSQTYPRMPKRRSLGSGSSGTSTVHGSGSSNLSLGMSLDGIPEYSVQSFSNAAAISHTTTSTRINSNALAMTLVSDSTSSYSRDMNGRTSESTCGSGWSCERVEEEADRGSRKRSERNQSLSEDSNEMKGLDTQSAAFDVVITSSTLKRSVKDTTSGTSSPLLLTEPTSRLNQDSTTAIKPREFTLSLPNLAGKRKGKGKDLCLSGDTPSALNVEGAGDGGNDRNRERENHASPPDGSNLVPSNTFLTRSMTPTPNFSSNHLPFEPYPPYNSSSSSTLHPTTLGLTPPHGKRFGWGVASPTTYLDTTNYIGGVGDMGTGMGMGMGMTPGIGGMTSETDRATTDMETFWNGMLDFGTPGRWMMDGETGGAEGDGDIRDFGQDGQ